MHGVEGDTQAATTLAPVLALPKAPVRDVAQGAVASSKASTEPIGQLPSEGAVRVVHPNEPMDLRWRDIGLGVHPTIVPPPPAATPSAIAALVRSRTSRPSSSRGVLGAMFGDLERRLSDGRSVARAGAFSVDDGVHANSCQTTKSFMISSSRGRCRASVLGHGPDQARRSPGPCGTSTACVRRMSSGTISSALSCVEARTTNAAAPS